jgi:TonB family protein
VFAFRPTESSLMKQTILAASAVLFLAACAGADPSRGPQSGPSGAPESPGSSSFATREVVRRAWTLMTQEYPPLLRDAGVGGEVLVRFTLLADGSTSGSRVTRADHELFGDAAQRVVSRLRFPTAVVASRPVPLQVEGSLLFNPNGAHRATFQSVSP